MKFKLVFCVEKEIPTSSLNLIPTIGFDPNNHKILIGKRD